MQKEKKINNYLFDKKWYLNRYPNVKKEKISAYKHYCKIGWKKGYDPSPIFSTTKYLDTNHDLLDKNINPILNYNKDDGQKVYLVNDKDIQEQFSIIDCQKIFEYEKTARELKLFNDFYYKNHAKNIKYKSNLFIDYILYGWKEGNNPSKNFSTNHYLSEYNDARLNPICPLIHYLEWGIKVNRKIYSSVYQEYKERKYMFIPRILGMFINMFNIFKYKNKKIVILLHLFYEDSWKEIKAYLKNLNCYNYDLYISMPINLKKSSVIEEIKRFNKNVNIYFFENRGYDVGPFIELLNKINLNNYDVLIKLQSKGTRNQTRYCYDHIFRDRDWFLYLYSDLIGPFTVHKTIKSIVKNKKIGMVASKKLIVSDPIHKVNLTKKSLSNYNIEISDDYEYVAGTCFACKAGILKEIQKLKLKLSDFNITNYGFYSLAHSMERYLCYPFINMGYVIKGQKSNIFRYSKWNNAEKELMKVSYKKIYDYPYNYESDFVYNSLEGKFIENISIKDIKLKDIKRELFGKIYKLDEVAPYKYLKGDKKEYSNYCDFHKKNNLPEMSEERFKKLIKSIDKSGLDPKSIIILYTKDLWILDGQHRLCYLYNKFGGDYKVKCMIIDFIDIDLDKITPNFKINDKQN